MVLKTTKGESEMTRKNIHASIVFALFLILIHAGGAQQSTPAQYQVPALRVGPGDLIELTMYDNPDLSGHFRVDEKGDIVAPLIGQVHVEGSTAEEIGKLIEKRYLDAEILPFDQDYATVFISEYASQGIIVSGEVKQPGTFPALGIRMLHDVITAAGGIQPTASSKIIITHKGDQDHPITADYNPDALLPVVPQIQIFPGDTVMVPRAGIVYVVGNVMRPGAYVLGGRSVLTVEAALALAGNTGKAAASNRAHLVRAQDDGKKVDVVLELNKILKGEAPDLAMKDGDILFVPTSTAKLVTTQAIYSALQIGTQLTIYRIP
jgi:polysaccharide biosynthesis/export protein